MVFVKIHRALYYPWRAVDQDGEVVDVFLQKHRDRKAVRRLFGRPLRKPKSKSRKIVADKLRSYGVAHRELIPETTHDKSHYLNNRCELSRVPIAVRERGMLKFKSMEQAQRFLGAHTAAYNLLNQGKHLVSAEN